MKPSRIRIVLVRPRNPGNIGACARAMGNFGFSDLVVVDPYGPVWDETRAAPDAETIVKKARLVKTFAEAVRGCARIIGTSSFAHSRLKQAIIPLPRLHEDLVRVKPEERIALVFGSERAGLSNDELAACEAVIQIPMAHPGVSMNLAQAVAVVLYEWTSVRAKAPDRTTRTKPEEKKDVIETWIKLADATGYPPGYTASSRAGRIRHAMNAADLPPETTLFLKSFSRWLWKKVQNGS